MAGSSMIRNLAHTYSMYSIYFAPRGSERLLFLGEQIAQRHLSFSDQLIGIIGDAGSGKSSLIKGMFPGMELANDDDTLNPRKIMQVRDSLSELSEATTFHIDMRFQTAFTQMHEIVNFVNTIIENGRRVIIEHFDLLQPSLGINADIMIGIGEEIIVTRPTVFGPLPKDIHKIVYESILFRKMAHTAEDITILTLHNDFGLPEKQINGDVRRGFVLKFAEPIDVDLNELEAKVKEKIEQGLEISYYDDKHISVGSNTIMPCLGPRLHLRDTSEIVNFQLVKHLVYDPKSQMHCLVGLVGEHEHDVNDLNKLHTF